MTLRQAVRRGDARPSRLHAPRRHDRQGLPRRGARVADPDAARARVRM